MDSGQISRHQRHKPKCCELNDLQRYPFAPATPARMNSGQISQYQRYKLRRCKFNDSTRELQTSTKICTCGDKSGVWKDFATGESGDNLLDLLYKARSGDFR
ncbi:MAG: hypothetical protein LBJ94_02985 [Puniceicoccales bacterium]|nr:hypothetical protein [Puniceicoccales bacterium]